MTECEFYRHFSTAVVIYERGLRKACQNFRGLISQRWHAIWALLPLVTFLWSTNLIYRSQMDSTSNWIYHDDYCRHLWLRNQQKTEWWDLKKKPNPTPSTRKSVFASHGKRIIRWTSHRPNTKPIILWPQTSLPPYPATVTFDHLKTQYLLSHKL